MNASISVVFEILAKDARHSAIGRTVATILTSVNLSKV